MAKLSKADLVVSWSIGLLINVVSPYRKQPIFSACVSLPTASSPHRSQSRVSPGGSSQWCRIAPHILGSLLLPGRWEIERFDVHVVSVNFIPQKSAGPWSRVVCLAGHAVGAWLMPVRQGVESSRLSPRVCAWKIATGQCDIDVPLCQVLSDV